MFFFWNFGTMSRYSEVYGFIWGFPGGRVVKKPPASEEIWVPTLGEEEMAALSRILVWRGPWTEEPGGLQSMGLQS